MLEYEEIVFLKKYFTYLLILERESEADSALSREPVTGPDP